MISKTKAKSEKCGEYGEPCLALKNRTCFECTPCRLCYIGMGYEQGKDDAIAKQNNIHDTFIRKQTLEEVKKEFGKRKYDLWSLDDFNEWLEEELSK